jgi:hypothetical protein
MSYLQFTPHEEKKRNFPLNFNHVALDQKNVFFSATGGWNENKKRIESKERSFLAIGGWNENKNALDLKNV